MQTYDDRTFPQNEPGSSHNTRISTTNHECEALGLILAHPKELRRPTRDANRVIGHSVDSERVDSFHRWTVVWTIADSVGVVIGLKDGTRVSEANGIQVHCVVEVSEGYIRCEEASREAATIGLCWRERQY